MSPRNHPCSCGSGRKYKRCHGALVEPEHHDEHVKERRRDLSRKWEENIRKATGRPHLNPGRRLSSIAFLSVAAAMMGGFRR